MSSSVSVRDIRQLRQTADFLENTADLHRAALIEQLGLKRYILLDAVGGIASTVLLFLPLTFGQVAIVLYGAWALVLGISGAIALRRALATNNQVNHGG